MTCINFDYTHDCIYQNFFYKATTQEKLRYLCSSMRGISLAKLALIFVTFFVNFYCYQQLNEVTHKEDIMSIKGNIKAVKLKQVLEALLLTKFSYCLWSEKKSKKATITYQLWEISRNIQHSFLLAKDFYPIMKRHLYYAHKQA